MNTFAKFYKWPSIFFALALVAGAWIGYAEAGFSGLINGLVAVGILCILEISLSFDNAVLNAKKLQDMEPKWRDWFVKWGMLIAVFGMRLVLPILIVSVLGGMTPWKAVDLGLHDPAQYAAVLQSSHHIVASFGGAFLMMVALEFFLDHEKDNHWFKWIEYPISHIGKIGITAEAGITAVLILLASLGAHDHERVMFWISGAAGIGLFVAIHFLKEYLESHDEKASAAAGVVVKSGLAGVLYLEVLDASMSFDGLIAAFAITQYFIVIMLGLGVGAFFVREMTLHVLDSGHLAEFRYLEHGAFYAIFALASIMLLNFFFEVPEVVTGLIGVAFLGSAVYHSHILNKREATV